MRSPKPPVASGPTTIRELTLQLIKLNRAKEAATLVLPNPNLKKDFSAEEIALLVKAISSIKLFKEIDKDLSKSKLSIYRLCCESAEAALILLSSPLAAHFDEIQLIEIAKRHSTHKEFLGALLTGFTKDNEAFPSFKNIIDKARSTGKLSALIALIRANPGLNYLFEGIRTERIAFEGAKAILSSPKVKAVSPPHASEMETAKDKARVLAEHSLKRGAPALGTEEAEEAKKAKLETIKEQALFAASSNSSKAAQTAITLMISKDIARLETLDIAKIVLRHRKNLGPDMINELLSISNLSIQQLALTNPGIALLLLRSSLMDAWSASDLADLILTHQHDADFMNELEEETATRRHIPIVFSLLHKATRENIFEGIFKRLSVNRRLTHFAQNSIRSPEGRVRKKPLAHTPAPPMDEDKESSSTTLETAFIAPRKLTLAPPATVIAAPPALVPAAVVTGAEGLTINLTLSGVGGGAGRAGDSITFNLALPARSMLETERHPESALSSARSATTLSSRAASATRRGSSTSIGRIAEHKEGIGERERTTDAVAAVSSRPSSALFYPPKIFDPYAVLGLSNKASRREIDEAYRRLSKGLEMDPRASSRQRLKMLEEAYKLVTTGRGKWDDAHPMGCTAPKATHLVASRASAAASVLARAPISAKAAAKPTTGPYTLLAPATGRAEGRKSIYYSATAAPTGPTAANGGCGSTSHYKK